MHAYPHHVNTEGSVITLKMSFSAYAITIITETYAPVGITKNSVCVFCTFLRNTHARPYAGTGEFACTHTFIYKTSNC